MVKGIDEIKNQFLVEKDIKKELLEIKKIIKSSEGDDVKLESIRAILNELAEEVAEAKASAVMESRTGLYSAKFAEDVLAKLIEESKRSKKCFSVVLVDIDYLKYVNDNFGHVTGTKMIIEVAENIKKAVRKSDIVARYGGDEFLLILTGDVCRNVELAVKRIRKAIEHILINGKVKVSVSIGAVKYSGEPGMTAEKLIAWADKDLYEEKKNRINVNLKK